MLLPTTFPFSTFHKKVSSTSITFSFETRKISIFTEIDDGKHNSRLPSLPPHTYSCSSIFYHSWLLAFCRQHPQVSKNKIVFDNQSTIFSFDQPLPGITENVTCSIDVPSLTSSLLDSCSDYRRSQSLKPTRIAQSHRAASGNTSRSCANPKSG